MNAIGGFLPLEIEAGVASEPYHRSAVALASGRACFHAVLRTVRPTRVLVPFYICDTILQPLAATATPFAFYAIDERFEPAAEVLPAAGEIMLVVNYFGVQSSLVDRLGAAHADRIVVDDTQAFFRRGAAGVRSFNSARKFFGVPDGAYLYGVDGIDDLPPSDSDDFDHLLARRAGDASAWEQFKRHEARVGVEPRRMSAVTDRLLRSIDMEGARRARRANFEYLHGALRSLNEIALPLDGVAAAGPMCYPFLPAADLDRESLARAGVFVPTLWPELDARPSAGFEWERRVARRLLPLPIDHRYGEADMDTIVRRMRQVL